MFQRNLTKGFTIVELMLSMSFVSILLITIAILTMNISTIYTKGITMKELNQVGSEISTDLDRSLSAAKVEDIKYLNNASYHRLCLGNYSYVWNEAGPDVEKYSDGTAVRLLKLTDPTGSYCTSPATGIASSEKVNDLLSLGGDRNLVVYELTVAPLGAGPSGYEIASADAITAGLGLYTVELTLGTGDETQIIVGANTCKPPSGGGDEYCAINKFTIVVAVGNTYKP